MFNVVCDRQCASRLLSAHEYAIANAIASVSKPSNETAALDGRDNADADAGDCSCTVLR